MANVGGSFWLVPDLTGAGLDDLVARPVGTTSDIVSGVVPALPSVDQTSSPIARPFAEGAATDLAGVFPNARYFPYAVNSGIDAQERTLPNRLLMAPAASGDVLGYDSLAPQITIQQGGPGACKSITYPTANSSTQVFSAGDLTLDFGDAESQISHLTVTLVSGTADDSLSFDVTGTSIVVPTPTISTGGKGGDTTRTYTFTTPAITADYRGVLRSIVYHSSSSPSPLSARISVALSARDRATAAADGYALASYQIANLVFNGTPIFTIPLTTDSNGLVTLPFTQAEAGANTPGFTLSVITQGNLGTGSIDGSGQVFSYQANVGASGTDEVVLSVVDDVQVSNGEGTTTQSQEIGQIRMVITVSPTLDVTVISGSDTFVLGESLLIRVAGGVAPYRVRANQSTTIIPVSLPQQPVGAARDALQAPAIQGFYLKPLVGGTTRITVTDANGTSEMHDLITTQLPSVEVPRPSVAVSVGGQTVFGAICPGTPQGVASLVSGLSKVDSSRGRGFTWEASSQRYVELPAVPNDGIGPTTGVFLAARADLGLDFSGSQLPLGAEIVLQQNWNFVGLGPIDDNSGTPRTSHSLATDFDLVLVEDQSVQSKDQIGNVAYFWNGASYERATVLQSNVGYWIQNVRADGKILSLKRVASGTGTSPTLRSAPPALKAAGTPPAPPAASSSSNKADDGGSCGSGSGLAVMLGGLLLALRMRFRR